ncbi:MAG: succinylglutamate-semialdehyde dehydrogenase [Deltaproteobacteria bacterium]|nr:succinylglutamate-semialdehyde dehydrogenase [Deltaproteobacteria bacterium]
MADKSHFINNVWSAGIGTDMTSNNPASGQTVWQGKAATDSEVDLAVRTAAKAFECWVDSDYKDRMRYLDIFGQRVVTNGERLAELICEETGKPKWEASAEVNSVAAKIAITLEAYQKRLKIIKHTESGFSSITSYRPLGVVAVLGPFNMPAHLPNGHIVPALLAGNTVVFKPSSQTPSVAQFLVELWEASGIPGGVINLLQGGSRTGQVLVQHPVVKGVFFTGSESTGKTIHRMLGGCPEKMLALEMGGNNPLIVHKVSNNQAAVYLTVVSAYITSGQRCSCARRLIVPTGSEGDTFLNCLVETVSKIRVGDYKQFPEPFMGPLISTGAAQDLLESQEKLLSQGARSLVEVKILNQNRAMLSPGIIDVTSVKKREDKEIFGPLLQLIRVSDFDSAIAEANNTRFGLTAGLFSDDHDCYSAFFHKIRTGVVNRNRQTTGASSRLPFGGTGASGNHRPGGYFTIDYCAYPVASMESESVTIPQTILPGIQI